ncbi:MAG: 3-hydroxyacyl-CoA dehydrogenase NAD-binding domain-containing protein [Negativicutes bacterium]|nr:3-hydroxyacyl-CoA dehydrogenase NAD-binding domain-containing protein [Negativicutes bacterium]
MMKLEDIKTICNLGTGTMGFGTAVMFAMAGYQVRMFGRSEASLQRGFGSIGTTLNTYQENGLVKKEDIPAIIGRIRGVTSLEEAAADADFVIESIAEDLAVKQEVFAKLDKLCRPETIFATNTSGLSPTAIAEALNRKDKFVVTHFWNPPHLVPLVEVVPGKHTSQETMDITWKLIERIGKKPAALNREALGFIGNRLQFALLREALYIVESGIASKEAVDVTVKYSLGRRLGVTGPIESADLGGLDIFNNISGYLMADLCDSHSAPPRLAQLAGEGKLGAKTGSGFYDWPQEELTELQRRRADILIEWLQKDKTVTF